MPFDKTPVDVLKGGIKPWHHTLELIHLARAVGEFEAKPSRLDDPPLSDEDIQVLAFVSEFIACYLKGRGDVIARSAFEAKTKAYYALAEERDIRM